MDRLYDVIIVGGGPAGLTAAIYLARAKYRVLVLEKEQFGGQIAITHEIVNYPGIAKTSGRTLTGTMQKQAEAFGAEFLLAEAISFDFSGDLKQIVTTKGNYRCFGVLLATGAHPRMVGFRGEAEFKGRGVAYCATCDGEFFTGKEIFVVGGGYAAAEESVFLTKFARKVTILIRKDDFSCAQTVADQARNHEKITVLPNTVLEEVWGKDNLTSVRYRNTVTGAATEVHSQNGEGFGVFVFAGYSPATETVRELVELDPKGYIRTDESRKTSVEGVYAAGDVCIKPLRQVVTAVSDGALAATELEKYVAAMQRKTGIRAEPPTIKHSKTDMSRKEDGLFTEEMRQQLDTVFSKMEASLQLKLYLNSRPVSQELERFITELAKLTDKLTVTVADRAAGSEIGPYVSVCRADGRETGLAFHGVPTGHEFTSFVLGLYNAAGPGQQMSEEIGRRLAAIKKPVDLKILVTLSCTMCPDLVIAAQHLASGNTHITAHVYDIHHFEMLKKQHQVMSVPCLILNDKVVFFGKKNMEQILQLIE